MVTGCLDRTVGTVGQLGEVQAPEPVDTAQPDAGPDVARDIVVVELPIDREVVPPAGCPALPATPAVLVQQDYRVLQPKGVVAREGRVFFGATLGSSDDPGYIPNGAVFTVDAGGGEPQQLDSAYTYISRGLALNERHLAWYAAEVTVTGTQSWAFSYPGVVLRDLETGEETLVGGELQSWNNVSDFELLSGSRLAVVMSSSPFPEGPTGHLSLFDPSSTAYMTTTEADFRWMTGHGDMIAAYAHTGSPAVGTTMVGSSGQPLTVLEENEDFHCCRLMAADEGAFYQRRGDTIEAVPWSGGPPTVIATDVEVDWIFARAGRTLYWAEHDEVWAVSTVGGAKKKVATTETGYIDALNADRCGVYFSANSYPRLMVMAAPTLGP